MRKSAGMTQGELSKLSGVSESAIRKFENGIGETSPSATTIVKLAKVLKVDFEYFFNDQMKKKVIQKRHYYLHENELIAKTPRFKQTAKLISFLQSTTSNVNIWESDEIEDFIFLPAYLNVYFCFYMPDNSMAPKIMKNDNICIFKTYVLNETVPCLFLNNDQLYLRKWKRMGERNYLYPINKQYQDIHFEKKSNEWQTIGISLYFWRDVRNADGDNHLLKALDDISS